ncbi:hypothetical protein G5C51_20635 [Streptomyces sp. A7024]|uniref:Uncharacterized protein n=1 Tax=Streptomyces coryli TaxID=1128680 RepID=A0A6G4U241_9ACTN|nr:hypothetical protein [Streptomyces coryli]NGN66295.1 hypothetical protein [Streptomyces coryli]
MHTDALTTLVANDALREILDTRRRTRRPRPPRKKLRVRVGWALVEVGLRLIR